MGFVAESIEAPIQGVSQQPDQMRLPGQFEEQINWDDTVDRGKTKRSPFWFGTALTLEASDSLATGLERVFSQRFSLNGKDCIIFIYKRTTGGWTAKIATWAESFTPGVSPLTFRTVTLGTGAATYLDAGDLDPYEAFRVVSLGDKAYLLNRSVTALVPTEGPSESTGNIASVVNDTPYLVTTTVDHNYRTGDVVTITLTEDSDWGGSYTIDRTGPRTFELRGTAGDGLTTKAGGASRRTSRISRFNGQEACVWIVQGAYSTTYKIEVSYNPVGAGVLPPPEIFSVSKTTDATDPDDITPDNIAADLVTALNTALTGLDLEVYREENVIIIYFGKQSGSNFSVSYSCSKQDHMEGFMGSVQRISQLPSIFMPAYGAVQVVGEGAAQNTPYFVRFTATGLARSSGMTNGVWVETFREFQHYVPDESTLPFKITEAANVFTIAPETWSAQEVGDSTVTNNLAPGFSGFPIRDLAFFRNRLVLAHGNGFSASESGDPTNFFRDTMLLTLDTDPIHVKALQGADNGLHWVVPFGETLVLFGDDNQFAIPDDGTLTQGTIRLPLVSSYKLSTKVAPLTSGHVMYALGRPQNSSGITDGIYPAVWEFRGLSQEGDGQLLLRAHENTSHVRKYLQETHQLLAEPRTGYLFAIGGSGSGTESETPPDPTPPTLAYYLRPDSSFFLREVDDESFLYRRP